MSVLFKHSLDRAKQRISVRKTRYDGNYIDYNVGKKGEKIVES